MAPEPWVRFRVWGLGCGFVGLGFGVWGLGLWVWGLGFGVWGLGFGVWASSLGLGFRGFKLTAYDAPGLGRFGRRRFGGSLAPDPRP